MTGAKMDDNEKMLLAILAVTVVLTTAVLRVMGKGYTEREPYPSPDDPNPQVQNIEHVIADPLLYLGLLAVVITGLYVVFRWQRRTADDEVSEA